MAHGVWGLVLWRAREAYCRKAARRACARLTFNLAFNLNLSSGRKSRLKARLEVRTETDALAAAPAAIGTLIRERTSGKPHTDLDVLSFVGCLMDAYVDVGPDGPVDRPRNMLLKPCGVIG